MYDFRWSELWCKLTVNIKPSIYFLLTNQKLQDK